MKGSEIVLNTLLEEGVRDVFGYPGGAVIPLYDALYDYQDKLNHILTAHEQGATHAADGYARSTGKVGVVFATSGPGATNTVTGIANAYMDSIPMVIITGQVSRTYLGKDSFQEMDITTMVSPITKACFLVQEVEELQSVVEKAFQIAQTPRKGPVLIDIPKDLFTAECEYRPLQKHQGKSKQTDLTPLDEFARQINRAKKPLIYAGGGVISSNTSSYLREIVDCEIPVVTSLMAQGSVDYRHPYNLGHVGMHGSNQSNYAVENCDLLLSLGTRFSDRVASDEVAFAPHATILQIDVSRSEIGKNKDINHSICGDLEEILPQLAKKIQRRDGSPWLREIKGVEEMLPQREWNEQYMLQTLHQALGDDTIVATDVGQHQMWTSQHFGFCTPRSLVTSAGLGTMGFGLGAAIGCKVGNPHRPVLLVTGDGSFRMNLNELVTVSRYGLKLLIVVMNNHALGMVRQWQEIFQQSRFSETLFDDDVDFVQLAQAFGLEGRRAENGEELQQALKDYEASPCAMVLDLVIPQEDNVYPMIPAGGSYRDIILK